MKITTYLDVSEFLQRAQYFMEEQEVVNNLILGITMRLREHPDWIEKKPYLAVVEDGGKPVLAAAITPPHNLMAAGAPDTAQSAVDLLIGNLESGGWSPPGVIAEGRLAERIAKCWSQAHHLPPRMRMRLRVYELRQVIPPAQPPPGFLRAAAEHEAALLAAWRDAFSLESLHQPPPADSPKIVIRGIKAGTIFVWDDGGPVSMAISNRPTPNGISIGGVYTSPELRRRGYASACVAALSQHLLDGGKKFCSLFTDLEYPTSNAIYQKIGYSPVCDFLEFSFSSLQQG